MSHFDFTEAAGILLLGLPSGKEPAPFWQAELSLYYRSPKEHPATDGSAPVVFKRLGLTTLAEATHDQPLAAPAVPFRAPTLMQAWLGRQQDKPSPELERPARLTLLVDGGDFSAAVLDPAGAPDARPEHPILVSPRHDAWPSQPNPNIKLLPLAMVEGRLPVALLMDKRQGLAGLLQFNAGTGTNPATILGGLRIAVARRPAGPAWAVELTPRGIEFETELPDPSLDFQKVQAVSSTMKVIVCLEFTADNAWQLRLSGAADQQVIDAMEARLAAAFERLRRDRTPLDLRFDVRPVVPSLCWPLEIKKGQLQLRDTQAAAGGFRSWTVLLDTKTLDARVRSGDAAEPAVATLALRSATLVRQPGELALVLNELPGAADLELTFKPTDDACQPWQCDGRAKFDVSIDLDAPAARIEAASREARALAPGASLPSLFVPVQDGWLQLPVPAAATANPPQVAATVLHGRVVLTLPRRWSIDAAARCRAKMSWKLTSAPAMPSKLLMDFEDPAGTIAGYLSACTASPDADDALPSLAGGAASLMDLPMNFGIRRVAGRWWDAHFSWGSAVDEGWSLTMTGRNAFVDTPATAWMRDATAGFVSIVPLTRAVTGSTRPSTTRGLLPVRLPLSEPAHQLVLRGAKDAPLARATHSGPFSWAETAPGRDGTASTDLFHAVLPTLPGVQFRPVWATQPAKGTTAPVNGWSWKAALRFGLPALDELFGSTQLAQAKPAAEAPEASPLAVTALDPQALEAAWLRSWDKIKLSWAEGRFMSPSSPWVGVGAGDQMQTMAGLADPFQWHASFGVDLSLPDADAGFAKGAAIGSYTLDGLLHTAGAALPGLGSEGMAVPFRVDATSGLLERMDADGPGRAFGLLGLAAPTWSPDDKDQDLQLDTAGLAIASRLGPAKDRVGPALVRRVRLANSLSIDTPPDADTGWLTLPRSLALGGTPWAFFARDLHVITKTLDDHWLHRFEGADNPCESALGADGEAFEPLRFGQALHEWRLFETFGKGSSNRRYELDCGPLAFTPLRLRKLEVKESFRSTQAVEIVSMEVLGGLDLATRIGPWSGDTERGPFGPERPYAGRDLFLLRWADNKYSLVGAKVIEGKGDGALAVVETSTGTGGLVTLQLEADASTGFSDGRSWQLAAQLRMEPAKDGRAELTARLLGAKRRLTGKVTELDGDHISCEFLPPSSATGLEMARVKKVTVRVDRTTPAAPATNDPANTVGEWRTDLQIDLEVCIRHQQTPLFSWDSDGDWRWLNLRGDKNTPEKVSTELSHDTGALVLTLSPGERTTATPLHGFDVPGFVLSGSVALLFGEDEDWPLATAGAPLHIDIEGHGRPGADGDAPWRLQHRFVGPNVDGTTGAHQLLLDMDLERKSLVRWPTAVAVGDDTKSSESGPDVKPLRPWARLVVVSASSNELPLLSHRVRLGLRQQALPVGNIGLLEGIGGKDHDLGIALPCWMVLPVMHTLSDGEDASAPTLAWTSLDHVALQPTGSIADAAAPGFHVYAARYKYGSYRGKNSPEQMLQAGVAAPGVGQSGFADGDLARVFQAWKRQWTPVLAGGSFTVFEPGASADPLGAVVPWLVSIAERGLPALPALKGSTLDQSPNEGTLAWRFAAVDAVPDKVAMLLQRQPREVVLSTTTPSEALVAQLLEAGPQPPAKAVDWLVNQASVSQSYFERFDKNRGAALPDRAASNPYFGAAMLVLARLWQSAPAKVAPATARLVAAKSILARTLAWREAVVVKVVDRRPVASTPAAPPMPPTPPVDIAVSATDADSPAPSPSPASARLIALDLMVLGRGGCNVLPAALTVPAEMQDVAVDGLLTRQQGRARVRTLARQTQPRARLVLLRAAADDAQAATAWRALQLPNPESDYGLSVDTDFPSTLPPSAALGWPSAQGLDLLSRLAPAASHDIPLVAPKAGLAGRRQGLGFPAWAPERQPTDPEALYVWMASHVVYQHPTANGPSSERPSGYTIFRGPAARHLAAVPSRLRAPCARTVDAALQRVALPGAAALHMAPIAPPNLERISVGHRPGELHAWTAALVVPAESQAFDAERSEYGRAASCTPVVARQLRTPRAPLLPEDEPKGELAPRLARRRRTWVSAADMLKDKLVEMLVVDGHATVVRHLADSDDPWSERRYLIRVVDVERNTPFQLARNWDGKLQLEIQAKRTKQSELMIDKWLDEMAAQGLVPCDSSKAPLPSAGLRIGPRRLPFESWTLDRAQPQDSSMTSLRVVVTLSMTASDVAGVRLWLDQSTANTGLALELDTGPREAACASDKAEKLAPADACAVVAGPALSLRLPLIAQPQGRPTLPVDIQTLVFGDPPYDRQLGSPVRRTDPRPAGPNHRMMLIADRDRYCLDEDVNVLVQLEPLTGNDKGSDLPALTLSLDIQPKARPGDSKPAARPLLMVNAEGTPTASAAVLAGTVLSIRPRALFEKDGSTHALLNAGDQLRVIVTPKVAQEAQEPQETQASSVLVLPLTDLPSLPPAPAVYSLVSASAGVTRTDVPLHACAPLPDRIEYLDLKADLEAGYVRRRALFVWSWSSLTGKPDLVTLVKVDRSGGMQGPMRQADLTSLSSAPAESSHLQAAQ